MAGMSLFFVRSAVSLTYGRAVTFAWIYSVGKNKRNPLRDTNKTGNYMDVAWHPVLARDDGNG
jgi:hypothetical protein